MTKSIDFYYDTNLSGHAFAATAYAEAVALLDWKVDCTAVAGAEWSNVNNKIKDKADITVQCFIPPHLEPVEGTKNVAIFYHEWNKVPQNWILKLEEFDAVLISSKYLEEVLKESGYTGEIIYCPIPMHVDEALAKENFEPSEPFTFISVGAWHFRKGFHLLLNSFQWAFGSSESFKLIIKTTPGTVFEAPDNVHIIAERLPYEQLGELYRSADAYVCTSLAEGFGLPVAEAMAHRLPVISHNWSGMTEFCGDGRNLELPFEVVPQPYCSSPDYYAPYQECGMINMDACAEAMKLIFSWTKEKRKKLAKAGFDYVKEKLDMEAASKILSSL